MILTSVLVQMFRMKIFVLYLVIIACLMRVTD